jgi:hypothetical protein
MRLAVVLITALIVLPVRRDAAVAAADVTPPPKPDYFSDC